MKRCWIHIKKQESKERFDTKLVKSKIEKEIDDGHHMMVSKRT